MKKTISQDLEALSEVVQAHHQQMGIDPVEATKQTRELVKAIGTAFHGDSLYIAYNDDRIKKIKWVKQLDHDGMSLNMIVKKTGIPKTTVFRILNDSA